ncbi:hypothetical protein [Flavobacterium sp.]|uniref:hypothetical protein n=1 Tax=Flavobacterium sp. TaxID=239 RepID=UPI00404879A7
MTKLSKNTQVPKCDKTAVISSFFNKLLYKYVDWERMWYNPKCNLKKGDKLKLNWKAKVYFKTNILNDENPIFKKIDKDNLVYFKSGETCNLYWLSRL